MASLLPNSTFIIIWYKLLLLLLLLLMLLLLRWQQQNVTYSFLLVFFICRNILIESDYFYEIKNIFWEYLWQNFESICAINFTEIKALIYYANNAKTKSYKTRIWTNSMTYLIFSIFSTNLTIKCLELNFYVEIRNIPHIKFH